MLKDVSVSLNNIRTEKPKSKIKIWVYSLKKNGLAILFCTFTIGLVLFCRTNIGAAKDGLVLWATAVIPSLFPFFVATEMLSHTNITYYMGKLLNPIMRPLFGVPGEGAFAFIMGLISGYPVGAKIVSNFMEQGICTKEEAERMIAFTNNSGPLFIIGTVGISLFSNSSIGILLFITHVLACISVGIILNLIAAHKRKNSFSIDRRNHYRYYNGNTSPLPNDNSSPKSYYGYKPTQNTSDSSSFSSLGKILGDSIKNATSTILMVGGFVVIFSVIISILNQSYILDGLSNWLSPAFSCIGIPIQLVKPLLYGIIELTNGVSLVARVPIKSISVNIILCAFLLGFGGFSILLQVLSIVSKNGLSIKKYILGKFLQGILASLYTLIALEFLPFLQLNLK